MATNEFIRSGTASTCSGSEVRRDLMVRAVRGWTADAPALKANAGISTIRGPNLRKPYTHSLSSWPEGARSGCSRASRTPPQCPTPARPGRGSVQAARAVGHRRGVQEFSASTATTASAAPAPKLPVCRPTSPSAAWIRRRAGLSTSTRPPPNGSAGERSNTSASTAGSYPPSTSGAKPKQPSCARSRSLLVDVDSAVVLGSPVCNGAPPLTAAAGHRLFRSVGPQPGTLPLSAAEEVSDHIATTAPNPTVPENGPHRPPSLRGSVNSTRSAVSTRRG